MAEIAFRLDGYVYESQPQGTGERIAFRSPQSKPCGCEAIYDVLGHFHGWALCGCHLDKTNKPTETKEG